MTIAGAIYDQDCCDDEEESNGNERAGKRQSSRYGHCRYTGPEYNSTSAKSDSFVHKCRIIPSTTFSPDDNPPIVRLYTKVGVFREEHIATFSSSQFEMLLCPTFCGKQGGQLVMKHRP
ncbi:hypothetical protein AVEN_265696-1 [Araneus ventricosus]|uniref:Uncharacterized protein n=1 Tax=Araneus ventricosus TaxID=182803 RepID=A0A4Y2N2U4_ARAVE|nr:hypothetical protein AVEN_265696-1 [Araneus ventricosus]